MHKNHIARYVVVGAMSTMLFAGHCASAGTQTTATPVAQPDKAKPRYGYCVDVGIGGCETGQFAKTGKGYAVCETYLKHLNALKEIPKCEAPIPPGFKQPVWEELDLLAHLQLAYQAEVIYFSERSSTQPDFETWRQQLLSEMQAGKIAPQLRETTVQPFGKKINHPAGLHTGSGGLHERHNA